VTTSRLNATGFEQFGGFVQQAGKGGSHPVAVTALRSATLANLCQSVSVGGVTMRIKAGGGGTFTLRGFSLSFGVPCAIPSATIHLPVRPAAASRASRCRFPWIPPRRAGPTRPRWLFRDKLISLC
jgi:hypothetical protein